MTKEQLAAIEKVRAAVSDAVDSLRCFAGDDRHACHAQSGLEEAWRELARALGIPE